MVLDNGRVASIEVDPMLEELEPDRVYVLVNGMIEQSGGPEPSDELEPSGYAAFIPAQRVGLTSLKRSPSAGVDDSFGGPLA